MAIDNQPYCYDEFKEKSNRNLVFFEKPQNLLFSP